eukprot:SAG31_NODE_2573_length_5458_cov_1.552528_3_plen_487_part_00
MLAYSRPPPVTAGRGPRQEMRTTADHVQKLKVRLNKLDMESKESSTREAALLRRLGSAVDTVDAILRTSSASDISVNQVSKDSHATSGTAAALAVAEKKFIQTLLGGDLRAASLLAPISRHACDELFAKIDRNADGKLSRKEIRNGLELIVQSTSSKHDLSQEAAKLFKSASKLFKAVDADNSNCVDADEFYRFLSDASLYVVPSTSGAISASCSEDEEEGHGHLRTVHQRDYTSSGAAAVPTPRTRVMNNILGSMAETKREVSAAVEEEGLHRHRLESASSPAESTTRRPTEGAAERLDSINAHLDEQLAEARMEHAGVLSSHGTSYDASNASQQADSQDFDGEQRLSDHEASAETGPALPRSLVPSSTTFDNLTTVPVAATAASLQSIGSSSLDLRKTIDATKLTPRATVTGSSLKTGNRNGLVVELPTSLESDMVLPDEKPQPPRKEVQKPVEAVTNGRASSPGATSAHSDGSYNGRELCKLL